MSVPPSRTVPMDPSPGILLAWAVFFSASISAPLAVAEQKEFTVSQIEFFETRIRPIFANHCYSCHSDSAKKLQAGLMIDRREGLVVGGDSGAAIVPGDAEASMLVAAVRYEEYEMPPKGKLADEEIEVIVKWVNDGAAWPVDTTAANASKSTSPPRFDLAQRKKEHWVWQPIVNPAVPIVTDSLWPDNDIDRFILHEIKSKGLTPASRIDKRGLIRRLYFDLIGLPPTPEEVAFVLSDESPDAVNRLIDRLLASTHFGERWGRHWLDLVRYAESRGHEFDADVPNAYQYRDYVIRAFNADVPYDTFVREQIAGDLMASPRLNPETEFNESILGTGFWFLGEWVHSPVDTRKDEAERFDNMIDVMSKTFLGVTVACARCHDHKFDAISTHDYYALSGFLQSSDYRQVAFQSREHNRKIAVQLAKMDASYRQRIDALIGKDVGREPAKEKAIVGYRSLVDYSAIPPEDLVQDGFAFGDRTIRAGDCLLNNDRESPCIIVAGYSAARSDTFWNSLVSETEKVTRAAGSLDHVHRAGRTLRSPNFDLQSGNVFCEVVGAGQVVACVDSHRLISGPLHGETIVNFESAESSGKRSSHWIKLNLTRYAGKRIHLEFTPAKGKSLDVLRVIEAVDEQKTPELLAETDRILSDEVGTDSTELTTIAGQWNSDREALKNLIMTRSALAMAMMDGSSEDDHLLIRGSSSNPGELVRRRFLEAIDGDQPLVSKTRSGRLELADRICDQSNPLTSRVIVNRLWHHLMGRGIVPTTDDFGLLGQRPTNPELLDHLASRFINQGQSIKQMIRYIVTSHTYQLSSLVDESSLASDPTNIYWHYRPPKRLEAEVMRDSLLAIAGDLSDKSYGPSVPIHLTGFMDGRGRPDASGPLDGNRRRSIYVAVRRNFVSPFMLTFDMPTPFSTMGRRNVSNVPAQALILMNDPFVSEQASLWAKRELQIDGDHHERLDRMYETAFAREPTEEEQQLMLDFVRENANDSQPLEIWTKIAHSLINTKEFIFLR